MREKQSSANFEFQIKKYQSRVGWINIPTSAVASVGACWSIPPSTDIFLSGTQSGARFYYSYLVLLVDLPISDYVAFMHLLCDKKYTVYRVFFVLGNFGENDAWKAFKFFTKSYFRYFKGSQWRRIGGLIFHVRVTNLTIFCCVCFWWFQGGRELCEN